MDKVRAVLDGPDVISADVASDLGRQSLRRVFQNYPLELSLFEVEQLWYKLQWTACSSSVADQYLSETCNAVRVFLNAYEIVHKCFGDGKHKPALQVLEALVSCLNTNEDTSLAGDILKTIVASMMETTITGQPHLRLKEACITLSVFLRNTQHIVPFQRYLDTIDSRQIHSFLTRCLENNVRSEDVKILQQDLTASFLLALLFTASVPETRTAAIKLFSLCCSTTVKVDLAQNIGVASSVIGIYLRADEDVLKDLLVDLFPAVLNDQTQFQSFLSQFLPSRGQSVPQLSMYLTILQAGRQKEFVTEEELPALAQVNFESQTTSLEIDSMEYTGFTHLLTCDEPDIRLQAFNLLTTSRATNVQVPQAVLDCFIGSLKYMHDDTDAYYRGKFISIARRFVTRLKRSSHAVPEQTLYSDFMKSWIMFLIDELSPQVSYQRHTLSLQILQLLMPGDDDVDIVFRFSSQRAREMLISSLLNLLFNAFEDVRARAMALSMHIARKDQQLLTSILQRSRLFEKGQRLSAATNRADHADALGRLFAIQVSVLANPISTAVSGNSSS